VTLALLMTAILSLAIGSVRLDSATSDEPAHIAAGIIKLRHGWLSFYRDQPPLWDALAAIPLVAAGVDVPGGLPANLSHFGVGRRIVYGISTNGDGPGHDPWRLLFLARLPSIALFIALCFAVYAFVVRRCGNRVLGVVALTLTGFCPNLMAHGRLATVDMAAAFFCFAAGALMIDLLERPMRWTAVALGIATPAALLSKVSTIILIPFFVAAVATALAMRVVADRRTLLRLLALATIIAIIVFELVVLGLASGAYVRAMYPETSRILVPFTDYLATLNAVRQLYARGYYHPQFLLGQFSPDGWWFYYPVAFMLKSTIPALLLALAAASLMIRKRSAGFAVAACATFVALFFAFSMVSRLTIGVRHILPVYPFLYAAIAIAFARLLPPHPQEPALRSDRDEGEPSSPLKSAGEKDLDETACRQFHRACGKSRLAHAAVVLALVWHVAETVTAYPGYISYFNECIGSMRNADRFLIDSNLDWGQDLRRLDLWCRARGIHAIALVYFGGAIPQRDLTVRVLDGYVAGGPPLLPGGWFALSRHLYRCSFAPGVFPETYEAYLVRSHARYVTTVGGSINVYHVE
jgi:hypothetical protein